jgi:GNAT superfamily N-acetyltransferase
VAKAHVRTTVIRIRAMTLQDLPLGMRLKEQAGWNQTEADWRRLLTLEPAGCFVAELDGNCVGTTCTCTFGPVAWVAMVLVDASVRGQGIGTAMMRHALAHLDGCGVRTVHLDATPQGRPIYEKLGFVPQFELARYGGVLPTYAGTGNVRRALQHDFDELAAFDREVTRTDRGKLLLRLFTEHPDDLRMVKMAGRCMGFLTARPGAKARQIGPCIAASGVGPILFEHAWCRYAGQAVFLDIPTTNTKAIQLAEPRGLTVQRHLLRMCRGEMVQERIEAVWASSGPEMG